MLLPLTRNLYQRDIVTEAVDVLLVEDSQSLARVYREYLERESITVRHVSLGREALAIARLSPPKVMVLDIRLPDIDGLDVLDTIQSESIPTNVVVITAHGSVGLALNAITKGARDYLEKPFPVDRLLTTLRNELEHRRLHNLIDDVNSIRRSQYGEFIGSSLPMQTVYRTIDCARESEASVFITGDPGTGKRSCARAIHETGSRAAGRFAELTCGSLPGNSFDIELLYQVREARKSGVGSRHTNMNKDIVVNADPDKSGGSTLFLENVLELDPRQQSVLLDVVQSVGFSPAGLDAGSDSEPDANIRFICSSTTDPVLPMKKGLFRDDLFYRLNVIPVAIAPLRHRDGDVLLIAEHYLKIHSKYWNKRFTGFDPDAQWALLSYAWPGNVSELKAVVEKVVADHDGSTVQLHHLPSKLSRKLSEFARHFRADRRVTASVSQSSAHPQEEVSETAIKPLWQCEREIIEAAIASFQGNIPMAAAALEVSPSTIYRKRQSWRNHEHRSGKKLQ